MHIKYFKNYILPLIFALTFLFGFQLMARLALEQDLQSFLLVGSLVFIGVVLATGLTFIVQKKHYLDLMPYLVHPVFLLIGISGFILFNENFVLRQIVILGTFFSYFALYSENFSDLTHHVHDGVKFFIIFMLYDSILEGIHFLGFNFYLALLLIFLATLLFQIHMLWRLKAGTSLYLIAAFLVSAIITLAAWILLDFYLLSTFLILSLMILAIYYLFWGIIHHLIEKNLTFKIFLEYLFISLIIFMMFWGLTTGF